MDLEGNGNDFGIRPTFYLQDNNGAFVLYVTAVYQNSPADKAGMTRSNKILKINLSINLSMWSIELISLY